MNSPKHILILDAIPFAGGSKIATNHILATLAQENIRYTVISKDRKSWPGKQVRFSPLWQLPWFSTCEQGWGYLLRQLLLMVSVIGARLKYGKIDLAIAPSGPGVDLALYLAKYLVPYPILQFIHGPVAPSKSIALCLVKAKKVYYLNSARTSIMAALRRIMGEKKAQEHIRSKAFEELVNGLPRPCWPSPCRYEKVKVFWAASLLKWKGLEFMLSAIKSLPPKDRPQTEICYIKPKDIKQEISRAPQAIEKVSWYQAPKNLDEIRAGCNIFVSTSIKEPFGLSILEALAAGHCVLIPADGAYWDQVLEHNVNCFKYPPGDSQQLANLIRHVSRDMTLLKRIAGQGQQLAQTYRAEKQYQGIKAQIDAMTHLSATDNATLEKAC
ncbi:glycosyltransferase family 4 protein [Thalassomonas actiniarum]|uniref:Glycosyltransferase family 4 protein n=1 Tax=Thalassomonas actiniarum TaxID=485447 RepID=A0AAE9YLT7_9GAMM|nr:glycosyltransferase family 4 protein [Thalassomonas actiniarum]WDD96828.1 glycosyltransferase family 4 protein [Thalassomonas actiniarum]